MLVLTFMEIDIYSTKKRSNWPQIMDIMPLKGLLRPTTKAALQVFNIKSKMVSRGFVGQ